MKKNKISIYFFGYFPVADMKKKKNWCKLDGLLPKLYCERGK